MATYAIGDLQGCLDALEALLDKLDFDARRDRLWFCGDLVNRGPDSLGTLRFVMSLGESAVCVLGNHDLHLLATREGIRKEKDAGMRAILAAPDSAEMLDWLRRRPLLHHDAQLGYTLTHAGIYPWWTIAQARQHATELEAVLRGDDYHDFLRHMYGNEPALWRDSLAGWDRLRFICNSFTRMRYCHGDGRLDLEANGPPGLQGEDLIPWFEIRRPREKDATRLLFGHWATLGAQRLDEQHYSLDGACVWGGELTALRIDLKKPEYVSVSCAPGE